MITYVHDSGIVWNKADGTKMVLGVFVSDETPISLDITGADVEGLGDNDVIAAGSTLITPSNNYIAFSDGVFDQKG